MNLDIEKIQSFPDIEPGLEILSELRNTTAKQYLDSLTSEQQKEFIELVNNSSRHRIL